MGVGVIVAAAVGVWEGVEVDVGVGVFVTSEWCQYWRKMKRSGWVIWPSLSRSQSGVGAGSDAIPFTAISTKTKQDKKSSLTIVASEVRLDLTFPKRTR